jgi:DNA-binding FadR family transcriptional regulator
LESARQGRRAESKFDRAIREFGTWIAAGTHERVVRSLEQIAADYHVNRAMARDICLKLQAKGLVSMRPRIGVTVQSRDNWELLDHDVLQWRLEADYWSQLSGLTDLRLTIEPHCARLAAKRATPEQQGSLRTLADRLSDIGRRWAAASDAAADPASAEYLAVDQQFHRALLAASGTEMLRAVGPAIDLALQARNGNFGQQPHRSPQPGVSPLPQPVALLLHTGVATAIYQRRPDHADLCMTAILHEVRGKLETDVVGRLATALEDLELATPENQEILEAARHVAP